MRRLILYPEDRTYKLIHNHIYELTGKTLYHFYAMENAKTFSLKFTDNLEIWVVKSRIDDDLIIMIDESRLSYLILKANL